MHPQVKKLKPYNFCSASPLVNSDSFHSKIYFSVEHYKNSDILQNILSNISFFSTVSALNTWPDIIELETKTFCHDPDDYNYISGSASARVREYVTVSSSAASAASATAVIDTGRYIVSLNDGQDVPVKEAVDLHCDEHDVPLQGSTIQERQIHCSGQDIPTQCIDIKRIVMETVKSKGIAYYRSSGLSSLSWNDSLLPPPSIAFLFNSFTAAVADRRLSVFLPESPIGDEKTAIITKIYRVMHVIAYISTMSRCLQYILYISGKLTSSPIH